MKIEKLFIQKLMYKLKIAIKETQNDKLIFTFNI